MSDFFQTGLVTTFHRLGSLNLRRMEAELEELSKYRSVSLILPCLFSEIGRPALRTIVRELANVKYLRSIVVSLDRASPDDFQTAKKYFSSLPQPITIIWNRGPKVQALLKEMKTMDLDPGQEGKGRGVWLASGYLLAEGGSEVIALHDCDIVSYTRELLARLVYPVVSYQHNYEYCKGYYSRVTNRMHGRVTRLFATPLVRSLIKMLGPLEILQYYDSFRYMLSGEFAMHHSLAASVRIPADWGLEVGMLAEVYRNCALRRICQSELCENYEHKHQHLSLGDRTKGLNRMAIEIAKSLFRTLASQGVVFDAAFFNSLRVTYLRQAQDFLDRYQGDATLNGLFYDRHAEASAIEMFCEAIRHAGEIITENPLGQTLIPNWQRVFAALPDFRKRLYEAIVGDNR